MTMQINLPPPRLSTVTGRAEPLEGVVAQALEKRPAARFDTAEDMLAAIDAALPARGSGSGVGSAEREPIVVRSPSASEVANRPTLVGERRRASVPSTVATVPSVPVDRDEACVAPAACGAGRDCAERDWRGGGAAFVMIAGSRARAPLVVAPAPAVAPTTEAAPVAPVEPTAAPLPCSRRERPTASRSR